MTWQWVEVRCFLAVARMAAITATSLGSRSRTVKSGQRSFVCATDGTVVGAVAQHAD